ncbi:MAG TPA: hypothetical protein VEX11_11690 [Acetobacteraceae bacterium]|nr:hypothetical protein [Acetobacteraceae bacterium]
MTIEGIYDAARARGLVRSRRQFSREFLGRAPNYAADAGLRRCSAGALLNLYCRLGEARQMDLQAAAFARLLDAETRERTAEAAQP